MVKTRITITQNVDVFTRLETLLQKFLKCLLIIQQVISITRNLFGVFAERLVELFKA